MSSLETTFEALADGTRREVIGLLRKRPRRAGELADALRLSAPAMSRQLRVLRTSGLIEPSHDEDDARAKVYRLRPENFALLRSWVEEVEQFWSLQLGAFKAHAEKRKKK